MAVDASTHGLQPSEAQYHTHVRIAPRSTSSPHRNIHPIDRSHRSHRRCFPNAIVCIRNIQPNTTSVLFDLKRVLWHDTMLPASATHFNTATITQTKRYPPTCLLLPLASHQQHLSYNPRTQLLNRFKTCRPTDHASSYQHVTHSSDKQANSRTLLTTTTRIAI